MEDTSGCFEVVLFPNQYQLYAPSIIDAGPYIVEGRVKEEWGTITLVAQRIRRMGYGNTGQKRSVQIHPLWMITSTRSRGNTGQKLGKPQP